MFYYVYILKCGNRQTYIGRTKDLIKRFKRHKKGFGPATKELRPVKLVAYFAFHSKYTAYNFEKYLKTGSGRALLNKRFI
jgi:putative endonuclease